MTQSPKIRLSSLQQLNRFRKFAKLLGERMRRGSYCYKRLDEESIIIFGEFAKQEENNLKYIQEVLTFEFLNNNMWMTERERKITKEAASLVVNFMLRCK